MNILQIDPQTFKQLISVLAPPPWYINLNYWNSFVLLITGIIITWYTIETRKLRIEAQKTNKYSFRPIIVAKYITSESMGRRELKIMNIGKGPALNIEFRISQIHKEGGYTNLRDLAPHEKFNNLSADEKQDIRRITTIGSYSKAEGSDFINGIKNKFAIIFTYEDIAGFKYQTTTLIEVVKGAPIIKKTITAEYDTGVLKKIV